MVSAVGSLQHVVQDGVTGLHVENADEETLAEGVLQILSNQSLAIRLGREGREVIEATYTWDRHIDGLMELYSEVLGNGDRIQSLGQNPIAHERGGSGGRIYSSPL